MLKFDKNKETATVLVETLPNRYFRLNDGEDSFIVEGQHKLIENGNTVKSEWVGEKVWVTGDIAEKITRNDSTHVPLARVIKTRSEAEAKKSDDDVKEKQTTKRGRKPKSE